MRLTADGLLSVRHDEAIGLFRPAADALFESLATHLADRAVTIVLSGVLGDGAAGTLAVRMAGGLTMAQNEATSDFFEMPSAAIDYGKAELIFDPTGLARAVNIATMHQSLSERVKRELGS